MRGRLVLVGLALLLLAGVAILVLARRPEPEPTPEAVSGPRTPPPTPQAPPPPPTMGLTITSIEGEASTAESESLHNRRMTVTDANGRYQLVGVVQTGHIEWLEASHDALGKAPRHSLPDDDATIDLVIGARGAIVGQLSLPPKARASVRVRRIDGHGSTSTRTDEHGQYTLEDLEPGLYQIRARGDSGAPIWQPRQVTVRHASRTSVAFPEPSTFVTLEVRDACELLFLRASNANTSELLTIAPCRGGTVTFESVEPGSNGICGRSDCVGVDVADTPARPIIDGGPLALSAGRQPIR